MKSSLPHSTRRFLASISSPPERYQRVMGQLYDVRAVLVHGMAGRNVQGHRGTDWRRLRHLAASLREEAAQTGIREATALFERLWDMADVALAGVLETDTIEQSSAA